MATSIRDTDIPAWRKIRKQVIARDNGRCKKCGRSTELEVHHITPVRSGGLDEDENLITLCYICHREWELVEESLNVPFAEWIAYPPYILLFAMYHQAGEKPDARAGTLRQEIDGAHAALLRGAIGR